MGGGRVGGIGQGEGESSDGGESRRFSSSLYPFGRALLTSTRPFDLSSRWPFFPLLPPIFLHRTLLLLLELPRIRYPLAPRPASLPPFLHPPPRLARRGNRLVPSRLPPRLFSHPSSYLLFVFFSGVPSISIVLDPQRLRQRVQVQQRSWIGCEQSRWKLWRCEGR